MFYEIWCMKNPSLLKYPNNTVGRFNKKQEMNYSCKIRKDIFAQESYASQLKGDPIFNIMNTFSNKLDVLFPKREIYNRKWPFWQSVSLFVFFAVAFYIVGLFIPANGFIAFDWVHVFSPGKIPPFYPPWDRYVSLLNWPLLVGLGLAGIALATLKRSVHVLSTVAVLISLPVFWTIFLGQLEGLVVVGLLALPWLTPLALLKPQVSFFAFGAKKSYVVAFLIWIAFSLVIWGFWPARMFAVNSFYAEGRYVQDIAIGWIGILIALPLFWFSRGDMDMLMIAGAFMTPHLIPYSMLPFTPAVARLKPLPAFIAAILSWLPFSSNWLGPHGWWLGWLFVLWLWLCLAVQRYRKIKSPEKKEPAKN